MLDFLEPVANSPDQQVATDPWRLAAIKPSPFAAQLIETGAVRGEAASAGEARVASCFPALIGREDRPRRLGRGRGAKDRVMA